MLFECYGDTLLASFRLSHCVHGYIPLLASIPLHSCQEKLSVKIQIHACKNARTGTHDAAADSGHCSVLYLLRTKRTNCRPTFSGASWIAYGWRATAQPWGCGPAFGDCVHWDCVPCWRGSMHASTGNELRRCIRPSWQQRLCPCVADHVSARAFARC